MSERQPINFAAYIESTRTRACAFCEIVAGRLPHHIIHQDDAAVVFLNKYPTLYGYTLVAPRAHREQVTGDFSLEEYLELQRLIYRVGEAIRQVVATERMYILSLGSQEGNRHVHWHLAPLPPGVPFEQQQFEALSIEKGVLNLSDEEVAALAARIRERMQFNLQSEIRSPKL